MKTFYITAAIPYVNAKPHVGHALEFVQGDVIARYQKLLGNDVVYLSGSDENALKNVQAAEKANLPVEQFCAVHAEEFENLARSLSVEFDVFQRSSAPNHHKASQLLWEKCAKNGDIYKKSYEGLYCVGCEAYYTKDELNENGECFEHPGKKLELVREENYFFSLSKYKEQILKLVESDTLRIIPTSKKNEVLGFLKGDVQDISISRSKERARGWGVEVPGDPQQIIYVWFDALNVYQSGVGFGSNEQQYAQCWPADIHLIGKGILRFHAVYWIAMLLSAQLQLPKSIYVHGYFTVNGQKMSKTLGNVIDPEEVINVYGSEALRYYFLREIPSTEDGDFSTDRLREVYSTQLANELGNLLCRLTKLCEGYAVHTTAPTSCSPNIGEAIMEFRLKDAMDDLWKKISAINKSISEDKLWEKTGDERKTKLEILVQSLLQIGYDLQPFLPHTAKVILSALHAQEIRAATPLFPRIGK